MRTAEREPQTSPVEPPAIESVGLGLGLHTRLVRTPAGFHCGRIRYTLHVSPTQCEPGHVSPPCCPPGPKPEPTNSCTTHYISGQCGAVDCATAVRRPYRLRKAGEAVALPVEGSGGKSLPIGRSTRQERRHGSHDRAHRQQGSHTRAQLAAGSHDMILQQTSFTHNPLWTVRADRHGATSLYGLWEKLNFYLKSLISY